VGQPILAAAGFQPALAEPEDSRIGLKKPPERRLRAGLPAPQFMQQTQKGKTMWHWAASLPTAWFKHFPRPQESSDSTPHRWARPTRVAQGAALREERSETGQRPQRRAFCRSNVAASGPLPRQSSRHSAIKGTICRVSETGQCTWISSDALLFTESTQARSRHVAESLISNRKNMPETAVWELLATMLPHNPGGFISAGRPG
jgi:hypothetical protein